MNEVDLTDDELVFGDLVNMNQDANQISSGMAFMMQQQPAVARTEHMRLLNLSNLIVQYQGKSPSILMPEGSNIFVDKPKGENMLTEITRDAKTFVREHKSTIYVIAVLLLADHFMFNGAFKAKLKSMMEKIVGQVEDKLNPPKAG